MSKIAKCLSFVLLLALVFCLPTEALAEGNIFAEVRDKAVKTLVDSRKLVFLLGGFGLIGFAFMAVFNKISWKWFANIAIGLFLVAVMGMFIAYFTGVDELADELDYGYDCGSNCSTDGTNNDQTPSTCAEDPTIPGCDWKPDLDPNGGPGNRL